MIYEHVAVKTALRKRLMRHRLDRHVERSRRWGQRFRRRMVERARWTRAVSLMETWEPYCLVPAMFTRRYLLRGSRLEKVANDRAAAYLQVLKRELYHGWAGR